MDGKQRFETLFYGDAYKQSLVDLSLIHPNLLISRNVTEI